MNTTRQRHNMAAARQRASVLVVVMWIVFGLISITLYFANSMTYELRASDNRLAGEQAEFAIDAARRYVMCVLSNLNEPGVMPDTIAYKMAAVPVGDAKFWFIGRTNVEGPNRSNVTFSLRDEAAKMNLNHLPGGVDAASTNLMNLSQQLPSLNQQLIYNIIAWGDTNTENNVGGAESQTYQMQTPPYLAKNGPYETVDELRLVYNMNIDLLYGEDANLNGALDPNENDGDETPPSDNGDGTLNPGLLEWFTVYTAEPATDTNGSNRINVTTGNFTTELTDLLQTNLGSARAAQILQQAGLSTTGAGGGGGGRGAGGGGGGAATVTFAGPLDFYVQSGMTPTEFQTIEPSLRGANLQGLVNVNTASVEVLECLPGMTLGTAQQLVTYRQANQSNLQNQNTVGWVGQAVDYSTATNLAPWITGRTYQYTADIAAVGHNGRGYRRVLFVIDTSQGFPAIVYRQDLTHLGWALGRQTYADLMTPKK